MSTTSAADLKTEFDKRGYIGPDVWVRWDQCVAKGPGGPDFPWHQDNAYNELKVPHYQLWVGITEMTEHNGGLWLQPGSHKQGLLPHHKVGTACGQHEASGKAVAQSADVGSRSLLFSAGRRQMCELESCETQALVSFQDDMPHGSFVAFSRDLGHK